MDIDECYAWGDLFAGDWSELTAGMAERANAMGLTQEDRAGSLIWVRVKMSGGAPTCSRSGFERRG